MFLYFILYNKINIILIILKIHNFVYIKNKKTIL